MEKEINLKKLSVNQTNEDLDEAVRRVYQVYGPDLSVFSLAVNHRLAREDKKPTEDRGTPIKKHA